MSNDKAQDIHPSSQLCQECQTGSRQLKYITYFTWLHSELITVPNFPAWVCDVCGRREYDPRAITWLNAMLHPDTGRKNAPRSKPDQPTHPQIL